MKPAFSPDRSAALGVAVLLAGLCVAFRLAPELARGFWNLTPIGALLLFCGARLTGVARWVVPFSALAITDVAFYLVKGWPLSPTVYFAFSLYLVLGLCLRRTSGVRSVALSVPLALAGSVAFFLLTNAASWVGQAMPYPMTFAGLMQAYEMGLPFARGTFYGDLLFSPAAFAFHALVAPRFRGAAQWEEAR